jgi:hypothetical protein
MLKQENRDAILLAVAKARSWIDDVASGCVRSFAEIAEREGKVERHIRLLAQLAFIPPRTLASIIDGTGPYHPTVTVLAQAVPYRWTPVLPTWWRFSDHLSRRSPSCRPTG